MTVTDREGRNFLYVDLTREKVRRIVKEHLAGGKPVEDVPRQEERRHEQAEEQRPGVHGRRVRGIRRPGAVGRLHRGHPRATASRARSA